ncbi:alpha/beta hydrolase family protein [Rhodoligotrophos ferricapiens]|uniref:alpha/beta hydrolase family protein n=1 Tax=Rhodoligotrophos ferricapiens TaxID=3069264 RepID=UPI00315D03AF
MLQRLDRLASCGHRLMMLLLLSFALVASLAGELSAQVVGIERRDTTRLEGEPFAMAIFYPAKGPLSVTAIGPYDVAATRGAQPLRGPFPLVMLSHGSSGSMLSHHDLATALAMNGFVVAAIEHSGDNYRDRSGLGKESTAYRRARQVSAAIDLLRDGGEFPVDRQRIGIVGYSAGTVTALMLAGAEPDFGALVAYCADRERDTALCQGGGLLQRDQRHRDEPKDARIKAALLLAPIGVVFSTAPLPVSIPTGIVAAGADRELPITSNVMPLAQRLSNLTLLEVIPLAGHNVFLTPCTARMLWSNPSLCKDPPMVDRQREHALLNGLAVSFFRYALGFGHPIGPVKQLNGQ